MITIDEEGREDGYGAAPVQAHGTLDDGRRFYFRARHAGISLEVGDASVQLDMRRWDGDDHPLSTIDPRHVRPLVEFMADVLAQCEVYQSRANNGWWRKPVAPREAPEAS